MYQGWSLTRILAGKPAQRRRAMACCVRRKHGVYSAVSKRTACEFIIRPGTIMRKRRRFGGSHIYVACVESVL